MNQRIKELALDSGAVVTGIVVTNYGKDINPVCKVDIQKFAELIVKECMDVASPSYMSTPEQGVYYVEQAIDRIAEHFGVE